jgi:hypothetical protein
MGCSCDSRLGLPYRCPVDIASGESPTQSDGCDPCRPAPEGWVHHNLAGTRVYVDEALSLLDRLLPRVVVLLLPAPFQPPTRRVLTRVLVADDPAVGYAVVYRDQADGHVVLTEVHDQDGNLLGVVGTSGTLYLDAHDEDGRTFQLSPPAHVMSVLDAVSHPFRASRHRKEPFQSASLP